MSPQQTCNMVTTGDIDSSTRTNSDECDTTFTAPDCSIDGETYTVPVGPENINSGLSNTNQEYIISSTSVDDHSIPTFAHNTSSEYFIASSSTSSSSTKVNCVRENVSNLSIDDNNRRKRVSNISSSSATATSSSSSLTSNGTSQFDNFENEFDESPTIRPYAEFAIENKRLTKIAQRSKFSPNAQAPTSSSGPRNKQM